MKEFKNVFEIMPKYPLGNSSNVYVPPTVTAASSHSKVTFLHHSSNNQRHSRLLVYHVNSHFVNSFFLLHLPSSHSSCIIHNQKKTFFRCSDSTKMHNALWNVAGLCFTAWGIFAPRMTMHSSGEMCSLNQSHYIGFYDFLP